MEEQIRKIVREEIARALSAAGEVADGALGTDPYQDTDAEDTALCAINKVMERVARDVLANVHPAVEDGQDDLLVWARNRTASTAACTCSCRACFGCTEGEHTASTEPVHTITAVPERPKATCTCRRHVHVMGQDDRCGSAFCYCLTPVHVQAEHTEARVHVSENIAGTPVPRACTVCLHGEHDQGNCGMHVFVDGVARPCPCLASRTLGAQSSTRPGIRCTVCEHAPHGAGNCGAVEWPATAPCECSGARS